MSEAGNPKGIRYTAAATTPVLIMSALGDSMVPRI